MFYEKYASAFHLKKSRGKAIETLSPSEAPSKPLRSQEQEQEQEKDFEQESRAGEGRRSTREREKQPQNLLGKEKQEDQYRKLLQGELKLVREKRGGTKIDEAKELLIICGKTHIPFEYAQWILREEGNGAA